MVQLLSRLNGGDLVAVVSIVGSFVFVFSIVLLRVGVGAWQAHRSREVAASIIEDMLEQGMSADQIERVLIAGGFSHRRVKPAEHAVRGAPRAVGTPGAVRSY